MRKHPQRLFAAVGVVDFRFRFLIEFCAFCIYNNNKGGDSMFQNEILALFEKYIVLTNQEIRNILNNIY